MKPTLLLSMIVRCLRWPCNNDGTSYGLGFLIFMLILVALGILIGLLPHTPWN